MIVHIPLQLNSWQGWYSSILIALLPITLLLWYVFIVDRADCNVARGKIVHLANSYANIPKNDKMRYLKIDCYPAIFEVFVGNEAMDFSPKLNKLDNLKVGDNVVTYFGEHLVEYNGTTCNRRLFYLDKDDKCYFEYGKKISYYFIITSCTLMIGLIMTGYWRYKKGRLPY